VMAIICIRKVEKRVRKSYGFIRLVVTEGLVAYREQAL